MRTSEKPLYDMIKSNFSTPAKTPSQIDKLNSLLESCLHIYHSLNEDEILLNKDRILMLQNLTQELHTEAVQSASKKPKTQRPSTPEVVLRMPLARSIDNEKERPSSNSRQTKNTQPNGKPARRSRASRLERNLRESQANVPATKTLAKEEGSNAER